MVTFMTQTFHEKGADGTMTFDIFPAIQYPNSSLEQGTETNRYFTSPAIADRGAMEIL